MITEFTSHVEECLKRAFDKYGVKLSPDCVKIQFNLKGKTSAQACMKGLTEYRLRFNREAIEKHWDEMVNKTIPHEVAHLIAWMCPQLRASGHNKVWKRICVELGGTGRRCHNYDLTPARKTKKYLYNVNGAEYKVGSRVHNKIQMGRLYNSPTGAVLRTHYMNEVSE